MVKAVSKRRASKEEVPNEGAPGDYEKQRAERIKENKERLHKLGILELTKKIKTANAPSKKLTPRITRSPAAALSTDPPRRSFRLKDKPPVSYKEQRIPKADKISSEDVEIDIPEGENPEVYTEEHEKLLGDYKNAWILYVDGYDEDGQRIYDPDNGKSCHQCRQKTLGQRTECSNCKIVHGQFCGDCLYTRYGENVIEANENADWICPVCRGICNCSRCRREKGHAPTGAIFKKVKRLGYKSVAHYLIKTRMHSDQEEVSSADSPSGKSVEPFTEFTNTLNFTS
ncbi:cell division cycle-associated 7-like protein [Capsicum chacoense]